MGGLAGVLESENGVWIIPKKMDKIIYWNREKKEQPKTECLPEKEAKSKKIDWKKFFTPEPKSKIKVVEPQDEEITIETVNEEKVSE